MPNQKRKSTRFSVSLSVGQQDHIKEAFKKKFKNSEIKPSYIEVALIEWANKVRDEKEGNPDNPDSKK